jgi:hypothetical protein
MERSFHVRHRACAEGIAESELTLQAVNATHTGAFYFIFRFIISFFILFFILFHFIRTGSLFKDAVNSSEYTEGPIYLDDPNLF